MANAQTAAAPDADLKPGADTDELRRRVKQALEAEGFRWELWQKPEKDAVFGMIRKEDEHMQLHVRYYKGAILKAERELCNRYLEHLVSPRESVHDEIEALLAKHDITEVDVQEKDFPDRMQNDMPKTRTPWKPLVMGVGAALVGAVIGGRSLFSFGDD